MQTEGRAIYDAWLTNILDYEDEIDTFLSERLADEPLAPLRTEDRLTHVSEGILTAIGRVVKEYPEVNYPLHANPKLKGFVASEPFSDGLQGNALDSVRLGVQFPLAITFDAMRKAYQKQSPDIETMFIGQSLGAATLLECVSTCTETAFGFWQVYFSWTESNREARAERCGLPAGEPIMSYDSDHNVFTLQEGVKAALHAYMRKQNTEGPDPALAYAGVPWRKVPFTAGCPIGKTGVLTLTKFVGERLVAAQSLAL